MDNNIENIFHFLLNHLIIEEITIYVGLEKYVTKYTDDLFKVLMCGDKFNKVLLEANNLQKLFDLLLIHIETSKDCSKMVANIKLNSLEINFTALNERAEKIDEKSKNELFRNNNLPNFQQIQSKN
uniref:Uncharacterized protein n=1 Tax=Meloidogyne enterolobii TaxID=390850 RepID=A0A6V7TZG8_MELEN|nr:unnamed protein product [Meloidogyne enterolobii]